MTDQPTTSPAAPPASPTPPPASTERLDHDEALAARLTTALEALAGLPIIDGFDPAAPAAIVRARLHLAPVPVSAGGLGIGLRDAVEVLAAIAAVDGSVALGFAMHLQVVGGMVQSAGWPAGSREAVYAAVVNDGALLNAASTEEGGGSPARGAVPETRAVAAPDGGSYRLTGEKSWTTWLPALRLALVTARIVEDEGGGGGWPGAPGASPTAAEDPSANDRPAIGLFVVDLDAPGISRLPAFDALGMRGSASGRLRLEGVRVTADRLVVRRPAGMPDPRGPAPAAWFGACVAGAYLGVGEGARRAVVRWAVDRRPGDGSAAVADLPTVQVRLGRLDAALRAARIVLLDVTDRWDRTPPEDRGRLMPDVTLAKLAATNAAALATDEALRIAGGPGFLASPLERAFRDARAGLINPPLEDVALQGFARALVDRERSGG